MAYNDLREWINTLHKAGELKRITVEVDPLLEMAEIADRAAKMGRGTAEAGGPALLFENVKGYSGARVLMNQFGSERRMKLALETESLDAIADRIRILLKPETPVGFVDKLKMLPKLAEVGAFFPKLVSAKDAACKQVILRGADVDLNRIPVLKTWPHDGGRFITLPCVITRDPKTGKRNVGMYRMQVYDSRTTGMHWQRQKVAAEHMRERLRAASGDVATGVDLMALTAGGTTMASSLETISQVTLGKIRSERMEVAVAIGTDPATTFSAIVPAPPDVEEYIIAGFLRQKPVELVKAETVDLEVPAN
ncbi:MAG TPA: UbiD family decarboxylase domain-containing protein, partial [Edaphobacter sp.]|nr:UbiD family decarboxylase domain-containing protein [Edaphobacter sp.]